MKLYLLKVLSQDGLFRTAGYVTANSKKAAAKILGLQSNGTLYTVNMDNGNFAALKLEETRVLLNPRQVVLAIKSERNFVLIHEDNQIE